VDSELQQWRDAQRSELIAARCAMPAPLRRQWNDAITQRLQSQQFAAPQGMVVGGY
jgi:hypothetical protein